MFKEENSLISISAKSYRSQRKSEKPHALHLGVQNVDIKYANCTCQAGASASCSHIIGLMQALHEWQLMGFTEVPSQLSCTSMPQQWGVPRGDKIECVSVPELNIVNPKPDRKRKPIQNSLVDCR
ncbi:hypothetical protein FSP39_007204 [Pinctada imbricata]|nr:hypothetical protein FSP39_007204 [Pinctada imbricata]